MPVERNLLVCSAIKGGSVEQFSVLYCSRNEILLQAM